MEAKFIFRRMLELYYCQLRNINLINMCQDGERIHTYVTKEKESIQSV
jgi:hypothetical protein